VTSAVKVIAMRYSRTTVTLRSNFPDVETRSAIIVIALRTCDMTLITGNALLIWCQTTPIKSKE